MDHMKLITLVAVLGALVVVLSACGRKAPLMARDLLTGTGSAGFEGFGVTPPETWVVDGKAYDIEATYFVIMVEGLQYTIDSTFEFDEELWGLSTADVLELVFPLIEHAYRNEMYKRVTVRKEGAGQVLPTAIGVVLVERGPDGRVRRGRRVSLGMTAIRQQVERGH